MPKKTQKKAVNAFIDTVKEAIAQKDKVQLIGFGTFEARVRKARNGRILAPAKPSKSRRLLFLLSRLAKLSRTPSTNNFA